MRGTAHTSVVRVAKERSIIIKKYTDHGSASRPQISEWIIATFLAFQHESESESIRAIT